MATSLCRQGNCDLSLQEIELFMSDAEKNKSEFFPRSVALGVSPPVRFCNALLFSPIASRFLHVIVPEGEAKCSSFAARAAVTFRSRCGLQGWS